MGKGVIAYREEGNAGADSGQEKRQSRSRGNFTISRASGSMTSAMSLLSRKERKVLPGRISTSILPKEGVPKHNPQGKDVSKPARREVKDKKPCPPGQKAYRRALQ